MLALKKWGALNLLVGFCLLFGTPACLAQNHKAVRHGDDTPPPSSEHRLDVSVAQDLVTLRATQVDLRRLLSELSKASGVPINASQLEKQSPIYISVSIKKRTIEEVLKIIIEQVPGGGFSIAREQRKAGSDEIQRRVYVVTKRGTSYADYAEESVAAGRSRTNIEEKRQNGRPTVIEPASIDPTVRDSLWESNHLSLLDIQKDIADYLRMAREKPDSVPYPPDFQKWADALYRDAILAKLLNAAVDESKKNEVLSQFERPTEPRKLSLIEDLIPTTKEGYAQALQALLEAVYKRRDNELDFAQSLDLASRFEDLVERRKRYSDSFYETQIGEHLGSTSIPLDQRLGYLDTYLSREDWSVVRYAMDFLSDFSESRNLLPGEQGKITAFFARVREREARDQ